MPARNLTRRTCLLGGIGTAAAAKIFAHRPASFSNQHPRIALVIGNAAYQDKRAELSNPVNDARALSSALEKTGFTMQLEENLTRVQMEQAISKFLKKLDSDSIALFYYAGHGMQMDGQNYLLPVDISRDNDYVVKEKSVAFDELKNAITEKNPALSILILDACRDNPFPVSRSLTHGLAGTLNPPGSNIIIYSTSPGKTAEDNPNAPNGLFASVLIPEITQPGLTLHSMFQRIAEKIYSGSRGHQMPCYSESAGAATETFYFVPPLQAAAGLQPHRAEPTLLPVRNKFALLVGIDIFKDPKVYRSIYASKDALDLYSVLTDQEIGRFPKNNVRVLSDKSATTTAIKTELNRLARVVGREDIVLVYFASQGAVIRGGGANYLLTYDTEIGDEDLLFGTALPIVEILSLLRTRVRAERMLLLFDFCHARSPWLGLNPQQIMAGEPVSTSIERGRVAITASRPDEASYETSEYENGVLTHFLLEGLRSTKGRISSLELFNYVATRVPPAVQRFKGSQHPVLTMAGLETRFEIGDPIG